MSRLGNHVRHLTPPGWDFFDSDDMRVRVSDAVGFVHPDGVSVLFAPLRRGQEISIEWGGGPVPSRERRPARRSWPGRDEDIRAALQDAEGKLAE